MAHPKSSHVTDQLSVRSPFARARASRLAKLTGMSITQIIEDALRAYQPAPSSLRPGGLVEKGGILVKRKDEAEITQRQVEAELANIRGDAR